MSAKDFTKCEKFNGLYPNNLEAAQRYQKILAQFNDNFDGDPCFFSTSGRCEIIGNHTDHNGGKVLAGSISLDTVAAACATQDNTVRLISEGYEGVFTVDLADLEVNQEQKGTTLALIRGVAARFVQLGYKVGGFDCYVSSNVLKGSGLSSSAAFEVLICTILSHFYNGGKISPELMGEISQYAENVYFGKPCGLMDQLACACGSIIAIDFCGKAAITRVDYDFARRGYSIIITDVRQDHACLTDEYAAIINDMASVAGYFGKKRLCEVDGKQFASSIAQLRKCCSDRAILRAAHFFSENDRVDGAVEALSQGDLNRFFANVNASGRSSEAMLQNLFAQGSESQGVPLALYVSRQMLGGRGAVRVHGGGFGGTVLAFVPLDIKEQYMNVMDGIFGKDASCELSVRAISTDRII